MQTTLTPTHPLKGGTPWAAASRIIPAVTSHVGDWHYFGLPRPSRFPWLAIILSGGVHAAFLLGFNAPVQKAKVAAPVETQVIEIVMPDLKDEEEPPPTELQDQPEETPAGVAVPTLMDVPSAVDLNTAFVQPLQVNVPVSADLNSARLSSIPVNISHGPRSATGLKDIFNISQLDRIPEPIAQPSPRFPFEMKNQVSQAEVVVEFIVDTDGYVRGANVVRSTHRGFEAASIDGVTKWKFRPGMKAGRKVNTRMMVPLRFNVVDAE